MIVYKVYNYAYADTLMHKPVKTFRGVNKFAEAIKYAKSLMKKADSVVVYECDWAVMYETKVYLEIRDSLTARKAFV